MLPSEANWNNWSRIFTDTDVWRGPVEKVLARLQLSPVHIHPGFPGTSAAFAVDCAPLASAAATVPSHSEPGVYRLVVKFYPPMAHGDFHNEVSVRTALHKNGSTVPYPRILLYGTLRDGIEWPYIIEEFCPGRATREVWGGMTRGERDSLARRLARLLADLHGTPLGLLADLHGTPLSLLPGMSKGVDTWRERTLRSLSNCIERLAMDRDGHKRPLPDALLASLQAFVDMNGRQLVDVVAERCRTDGGYSLCLIHNDLTEDHLLIHKGNEKGHEECCNKGSNRYDGTGTYGRHRGCQEWDQSACHEVNQEDDAWRITALLDYGDAKVGLVEEEWVVLSTGLFEMDSIAMRVFLDEYRDLTGAAADAVCPDNPSFREKMLLLTLAHQFCGEIICQAMRRVRVDLSDVTHARTLMDVLWPIPA